MESKQFHGGGGGGGGGGRHRRNPSGVVLWSWGRSSSGCLGHATAKDANVALRSINTPTPIPVFIQQEVVHISCSRDHAAAVCGRWSCTYYMYIPLINYSPVEMICCL